MEKNESQKQEKKNWKTQDLEGIGFDFMGCWTGSPGFKRTWRACGGKKELDSIVYSWIGRIYQATPN
jgi:hypothetical protein